MTALRVRSLERQIEGLSNTRQTIRNQGRLFCQYNKNHRAIAYRFGTRRSGALL
jgi:hypothetical protein